MIKEREGAVPVKYAKKISAVLLAAACLLCVGCKKNVDEKPDVTLSYENVTLFECVRLGAYEGLTVTVAADTDKAIAVWAAVRSNSEILQYPEEAVAYYVAQAEARCRYYAEEHGVDENEAMVALGTSRAQMESEARSLVADDLIVLAVQKDAGIVLTEDEKARLFDKYADKYVADFGYDREYVKENLSDLIYESMLYDKTAEKLITMNSFK